MILISPDVLTRLNRLSAKDAKRTLAFVDKFQKNPANPGISLERLTGVTDPNLWSARVTQDLRAILHQGDTWTILYIDHHDDAYRWAERRKILRNPTTGALQIVETTEEVEAIITQRSSSVTEQGIFDKHKDDYLLSLGLPENWLPTLRKIKTEDILLEAIEKLPPDVGERLLDLADGKFVTPPVPIPKEKPVTASPDTLRRFFVIEKDDELVKMLEAPLHSWLVFLHPSQRNLAYGDFKGPVKVTGSAGTGKTVVALHRAKHLAALGKSVLLTSFVTTLCDNLRHNIEYLCTVEELARISVATVHKTGLDLLRSAGVRATPVGSDDLKKLFENFLAIYPIPFDVDFLDAEWDYVIQEQAITTWDQYRSAARRGLGHPLRVAERKQIWEIFARTLESLKSKRLVDYSQICREARELLESGKVESPFSAIVVDEVQDLKSQELRFLAALAAKTGSLMLAGDGGQRIYAKGSSLNSLGINVRGRSKVLRINYRTTAEIRWFADLVLGKGTDDLDGGAESRGGTRDLLKGPVPVHRSNKSAAEQADFVTREITDRLKDGLKPEDVAVFARVRKSLDVVKRALASAAIPYRFLTNENESGDTTGVTLATMHRAKGLEFKIVFVIDASEEMLPLPSAFKRVVDSVLRRDAVQRERQLLYVSLTRARDELFVCWVGNPTNFLDKTVDSAGNAKEKLEAAT
jgi:superfamily I DNA/RNA helicase